MDIETFREYCLAVKGATESTPFIDRNVLVFKVMGKMFCMMSLEPKDGVYWADLKCNPEYTIELREKHQEIGPPHIKTALMWHRIVLDSDVPDKLIVELINHSAREVIKKLPKKKQAEYNR
ncbi:MmcQ/YjbR family DNA-binding protein [Bacteroides sp. 51]|uniref:MmcQ/YjbR family DNA-binding protein n=1 Tax=Bacteroides sp. 51 TaxID=2302938 RepID=UPI0013D286DF|nr:MmcQ/YjbR family DNA-binding protein [Bacteroides sp. 51]NDV82606.1 MmcQ/YjbR family DNA-binding protein [Bacteroides sp. 51]